MNNSCDGRCVQEKEKHAHDGKLSHRKYIQNSYLGTFNSKLNQKKKFLEEFISQIIMYITYIQQSLWQKKLLFLLFLEIVYWSTL